MGICIIHDIKKQLDEVEVKLADNERRLNTLEEVPKMGLTDTTRFTGLRGL